MTAVILHHPGSWDLPRPAAPAPAPLRPLPPVALPLSCPLGESRSRLVCALLVLLAHLAAAWALWQTPVTPVVVMPPGVVAVRWVAAPAPVVSAPAPPAQTSPEPPPAPQPVVTPKPVAKPKPVVKPKPVAKPKPAVKPSPVSPKPVPPVPQATPAATKAVSAPAASAPAQGQPQGPSEPQQTAPLFNAAYLNNPAPVYPPLSRRFREEGQVLLRVKVSAEGLPLAVELARSSGHPRLDTAARNTVLGWRFVPARQGEQPVAAWVKVPIVFQLRS